jgi:hypothetical protein
MKLKHLVENILLEASKKEVLINKIGLSEDAANRLVQLCGPLAVFMANKLIDVQLEIFDSWNENHKTKKDAIDNLGNLIKNRVTQITGIMDWIRVGLNGNISEYKDTKYNDLLLKAARWHDSLGSGSAKIDYVEEHNIIIDFREDGIGYYWCALGEHFSEEEKERMGHCARSAGYLYSLREYKRINDKHTLNRSALTASINHSSGYLLQLKGVNNSKPKAEYHKYIIPLLEDYVDEHPLIYGFGYEYDSKNDFKISDLNKEQVVDLYAKRPDLFEGRKEKALLVKYGLITAQAHNPMFSLKAGVRYIEDYIKLDRNFRKDVIEDILNGNAWELWDNWDADWRIGLDYYINKQNEEQIWTMVKEYAQKHSMDINDLSLEEAIEETDFDEIKDAIRQTINSAESDAYYDYIYKELKDTLSYYGDIKHLNDTGMEIEVNLDYFVDKALDEGYVSEEGLEEIYTSCDEDTDQERNSCIFSELLYNDYIDKPNFSLDDRYTPDVNHNNFNEILNDRLHEI